MCLRRRVPLLSLSFRLPFVFPQVTGNWVNSISPYGRHLLLFFAPEISGPRTIFSLLLFLSLKYFPSFLSAYVSPLCTMYVLLCIHAPQSMSSSDRRSKKRGDFQKLWQGEEQRKYGKGGKEKKVTKSFFLPP